MPSIIQLCRELRQRQTPAESILWNILRNRNFTGKKFLRQHPICVRSVMGRYDYYIPDFYCDESKLVIEADGPVHLYKKKYDKNRDIILSSLGLTILRFKNVDIEEDLESVLEKIKQSLRS
ncbi:endonuclease domain-containing protein [Mucilaginibacter sp. 14171R-50]|uniref:endonuclease domain-containing protein n=1 Tax=Mucilaginibacter sp. 14171R-50 TaxID=2703789 RepID=UPI00138BDAF0|nr:endonuclease domain-containing protein [Mucilaginibacter sp. 14171R-50]QHS57704.1 endonuclease domain-containing protein [Mucilaginibacter sp. 14171R-50]